MEAREVSDAPKTSEVKTEVKTEVKEGEMKDNSEVGTVDEDQRKLFVGGLAQVTARSSSYDHFCDTDIYGPLFSSILLGGERH